MNIIQIIPGSGGSFYCGNCMRDSKYVNALRKLGHNVIKVPMYLPLFAEDQDNSDIPIFYGAISTYLKQQYPIFRKAPKWFDKILNSKPLMKLAASMAGSTRADGLEDMTISMLLGEEGKQKDELDEMVNWISEHCKPDVIHISNALLLGLARRIREKMSVPVVCSLQDEDVWVDAMKPEFRQKIWNLMHDRSKDVDAMIGVSHFFSNEMKKKMNLPDDKVHCLYLGVDYEDYKFVSSAEKPRNVGYISRMCHENGFHIVVDAFILLKKDQRFKDVKLIATGGSTGDDSKYIKEQKRKIQNNGLEGDFEIIDNFEGDARNVFFEKVAIVSVPVLIGEAFGMYLLESMASGIPVVQPALGAFPEIIELSEGGIIYEPNTSEILSETWKSILLDPEKLESLSNAARQGVKEKFNIHNHANEIVDLYKKLIYSNS